MLHHGNKRRVRSVALHSFGCRTNQEEMTALACSLRNAGFTITGIFDHADVVIINSCSVTAHTEVTVRQLVRSVAREYPHARMLITGCMAQRQGEELLKLPGVAWVVGNNHKQEIPTIIATEDHGVFVSPISRSGGITLAQSDGVPRKDGRTRYAIKIQEGCDYACSYCIVPRLRGPSRWVSADEVLRGCERALSVGFKEIVLTGTHIGQYGAAGGGLERLVERIVGLPGDFRIRISSLDPREATPALLDYIASHSKVCDHLHLSMQHASPGVLAAMNRPYRDHDALLDRFAAFRRRCPHAGIGADFIVGFPGESEHDFETLLYAARAIGFSYAHVFRFSPRPGTAAASLPGMVPEPVKTVRSRRLRECIAAMRRSFVGSMRGVRQRIIVENEQPVRGVTGNYLTVEIPHFSALHNSWCNVIMEGTVSGRTCAALPEKKEDP